jgi:hypothetical protein
MEVFIKDSIKKTEKMAMVFFSMLMVLNMTDSGLMIYDLVMVHIIISMAINIKEIGVTIFNKVWEHIIT